MPFPRFSLRHRWYSRGAGCHRRCGIGLVATATFVRPLRSP